MSERRYAERTTVPISRTIGELERLVAGRGATGRRQVRIVLSQGYADGPLEERSRELHTVMWAKILLLGDAVTSLLPLARPAIMPGPVGSGAAP